jgi:hypothetical protein
MKAILLVLFLFCTAALQAAELTVWRLPAGLYSVQNGLIVKVNEVTLDNPPTPGPTPDPTPVLTVRANAIKDAALKVTDPNREETAANLAGLWGLIKQQVDAGKITGQAVIAQAINIGNSQLLGLAQSRQWKPVTDLFAQQWNDQVRDNSGDAALSGYLGEAVSGLKASAPSYSVEPPELIEKDGQLQLPPDYKAGAGGLKAINWERLLQILMMIMQLLGPILSKVQWALSFLA